MPLEKIPQDAATIAQTANVIIRDQARQLEQLQADLAHWKAIACDFLERPEPEEPMSDEVRAAVEANRRYRGLVVPDGESRKNPRIDGDSILNALMNWEK